MFIGSLINDCNFDYVTKQILEFAVMLENYKFTLIFKVTIVYVEVLHLLYLVYSF